MDYECDAGYMRSESSNTCVKITGKDDYNKLSFQEDVQAAQCESQSFYTISQGYRKIPGNHCIGGVQLEPIKVSCSYFGGGWFSLGNLLLAGCIGALLYYGWTYVEAVLILLPIPDPSSLVDSAKNVANQAKEKVVEMSGKQPQSQNYTQGFDAAPRSLEDDEDDDEDEELVGKRS